MKSRKKQFMLGFYFSSLCFGNENGFIACETETDGCKLKALIENSLQNKIVLNGSK